MTELFEEELVLPIFIEAAEFLPPLENFRETPLFVESPILKRRLEPPVSCIDPLMIAVPLLTVMIPAYALLAEKVVVPPPFTDRLPTPLMTLEKRVESKRE